jgi:hypothetical protein
MAEKTLEQRINECVEKGAARSLILTGLDRIKSKAGCERELDILENDETSPSGHVVKYSRESYATRMKEQAWADWEHYRDAQPHLPKDAKPTSRWAQEIVYWEAMEKVRQMESRALRKRLRQLEEVEEKERQRKVERLRHKGIGRIRGGVLVEMDGRKVKDNTFVDDGSRVAEYLDKVSQLKIQRSAKKKSANTDA